MIGVTSPKSVSIGGDVLRLKGDVGFGIVSQQGGRIRAFYTAERSGVSVIVGGRIHRNDQVTFLAQPGEEVSFRDRLGPITGITILGLSPDGKSVLVH